MKKDKSKEEMEAAKAEANRKAEELSKQFNCKVFPLVFRLDSDSPIVVGYFKEPPRFMKLRMLDKMSTSPITAASEALDAYLIKEHSSKLIEENDEYYIGACLEMDKTVKVAMNQVKKN